MNDNLSDILHTHTDAAYAWENKHVDFQRNTGIVFRLHDIWRDMGRRSSLRVSMLPFIPVDGGVGAFHKKAGRDHVLMLPFGCGDAIALHELAHALADAKQRRWILPIHGQVWADAYIGLLGDHMGADVKALRESYRIEAAA